MEFFDNAIIIHSLKYGESSLIVTLFAENKGLKRGIIRVTNKNKHYLHIGNILEVKFKSRLEEHLPSISIINSKNIYPLIFDNNLKLKIVLSISGLLKDLLQENEPHKKIFKICIDLLNNIKSENVISKYIEFEMVLLSDLGFGLDLEKCVQTGTKKDLKYISPKTGKAVCKEVGKQFHEKLFKLPQSFINYTNNSEDNLYALKILRFFIEKNLYSISDKNINICRTNLENLYADQNDS